MENSLYFYNFHCTPFEFGQVSLFLGKNYGILFELENKNKFLEKAAEKYREAINAFNVTRYW